MIILSDFFLKNKENEEYNVFVFFLLIFNILSKWHYVIFPINMQNFRGSNFVNSNKLLLQFTLVLIKHNEIY